MRLIQMTASLLTTQMTRRVRWKSTPSTSIISHYTPTGPVYRSIAAPASADIHDVLETMAEEDEANFRKPDYMQPCMTLASASAQGIVEDEKLARALQQQFNEQTATAAPTRPPAVSSGQRKRLGAISANIVQQPPKKQSSIKDWFGRR